MGRRSLFLLLIVARPGLAQSIDTFFKETFEQMVRADPEFATSIGRHENDNRWTDWSKAARAARRQFLAQRLSALDGFSASNLSAANRLTMRLIQYDFRARLDAWELETHLFRMGQLFGFHNRVYDVVDRMPARTVHDYENIIARLRGLPDFVDQNIAILDEAIAAKITQPRIVANLVLEQIAAQMHQDSEHTALLNAFRKFPSNIAQADQQRLRGEGAEAYDRQFLPAWRKLHAYIATTYIQHVRPSDSLSSIPGGRDDYAILVRRLTTTNLAPDEIHMLGEEEVKRIEGELQAVLNEIGFKGVIAEFQAKLDASPEQHFRTREEMLAYCRNIAKIIEPELPNQFRHIPTLLYGIRAIPPDREAATATNAQVPSPDFAVPGWMNLNTYQPEKQVRYDKESLVLHEAVPGHIFQGTVAITQPVLPEIRKFYNNSAFGEGWALYAESLGSQLGLYRDPYSRFGQLTSERFRAVRLVVDTGIHQFGWTREQALQYFHEHAPEEAVAEVDRYISWPGQALSYKMGELRIRALRTKAEQQLGAKFDVREFNDAVIRDGRLPLDLLSEQIDQYISTAASR
jgi:uncharacterized protein (DUF885 family)